MQTLSFRYFGRVGHFMRAEMNASALSYPVPPRTALLGLLGAILGMAKDAVSTELGDAAVGLRIRESMPVRHYHKANVRKRTGIINPISVRLKPAKSGTVWDETSDWGRGAASQVTQEWLLNPDFDVFVASSQGRHWFDDLVTRFQTDIPACHFTPCLGTAWMIARLEKQHLAEAAELPESEHAIETLCRTDQATPPSLKRLMELRYDDGGSPAVQEIRLPRDVTADRIFSHADYFMEMNGRAVPLHSGHAWQFGERVITFL